MYGTAMSGLHISRILWLRCGPLHKGQFQSRTTCVKAFVVPKRTFMTRLKGTTSCHEMPANSRKLSHLDEETLKNGSLIWINVACVYGHQNVRHLAQLLLSARLRPSQDALFNERWVPLFIQRHPELRCKYTRQYDYQRVKCEDPGSIKGWLDCVQRTIQRYGILEQDILSAAPTEMGGLLHWMCNRQ